MSCEKFERLIALYVEGDLSDGEERRLRDHLEACPVCSQFADELRETQRLVKTVYRQPVAAALLRQVRARVMAEVQADRRYPRRWFDLILPRRWSWPYASAGIGITLMLGGLSWWLVTPADESQVTVSSRPAQPQEEDQFSTGITEEPAASRDQGARVSEDSDTPLMPVSPTGKRAGGRATTEQAVRMIPQPPSADPKPGREGIGAGNSEARGKAPQNLAPQPPASDPSTPRIEIVSIGPAGDPSDPEAESVMLKIASNNPDILIYWVMEANGD